eukprot:GHVS01015755.1.p1 GENE.GHVS01015755.1~~GHVS01015755.1.p1  ORF type:complete len:271 (-),score=12.64 GHVS01015755.1:143-922(-)
MAVEANPELSKGWCKDHTDCQNRCLKSQTLTLWKNFTKRQSIVVEGEVGLCRELFDLWLTADSADIIRQVTETNNEDERKALRVKFSDSLPVVFCKVKNPGEESDCTDSAFCQNFYMWNNISQFRLNVGDTGICSNMPHCTYWPDVDEFETEILKTYVYRELFQLLVNLTKRELDAASDDPMHFNWNPYRWAGYLPLSSTEQLDAHLKKAKRYLKISDDQVLQPNHHVRIARRAIINYIKDATWESSEFLFIHFRIAIP